MSETDKSDQTGTDDEVEVEPAIEFITEDEYYINDGMAQEQMIWYDLDKILFNKDTHSTLSNDEIRQAIGYGTLDIFENENSTAIFVRNNMLNPPTKFRIDKFDAAWCDEGDNGDTYDDDE